jgi:hypothetical protein
MGAPGLRFSGPGFQPCRTARKRPYRGGGLYGVTASIPPFVLDSGQCRHGDDRRGGWLVAERSGEW